MTHSNINNINDNQESYRLNRRTVTHNQGRKGMLASLKAQGPNACYWQEIVRRCM